MESVRALCGDIGDKAFMYVPDYFLAVAETEESLNDVFYWDVYFFSFDQDVLKEFELFESGEGEIPEDLGEIVSGIRNFSEDVRGFRAEKGILDKIKMYYDSNKVSVAKTLLENYFRSQIENIFGYENDSEDLDDEPYVEGSQRIFYEGGYCETNPYNEEDYNDDWWKRGEDYPFDYR